MGRTMYEWDNESDFKKRLLKDEKASIRTEKVPNIDNY